VMTTAVMLAISRILALLTIVIWSAFPNTTVGRSRLSKDCSGLDALEGSESP
jgi:hypothetical protein